MLRISLQKRSDGGAVLKCVRADGTETWQKQEGKNAAFFPLHDLTHFSVESELGLTHAFFGLIAQGWSIDDTGGKGAHGALPDEAVFAEHVVGMFDTERASAARWTAEEVNDMLARKREASRRTPARVLTDDELWRIRKRRAELFAEWAALAPGAALDLRFDPERAGARP